MNKINCELKYVSASCNRYGHCIDWGYELICYATKNAIAVYDANKYKVMNLLLGHESAVNSVKWIHHNCGYDFLIISASGDGSVIIWQRTLSYDSPEHNGHNIGYNFDIKYKLIGHNESVMIADAIISDNEILSVTVSSDKTSRLWKNDNKIGEIKFDNFIFDAKIIKCSFFPNTIVAYAGADEMIHLYSLNNDNSIKPLIKLSGHEDWVRSIDITIVLNEYVMIASASQDCFIRIHKIKRTEKSSPEINEKFISFSNDNDDELKYVITLETVLSGHDDWVCDVRWTKTNDNLLQLLSASSDKTMILWEQPLSSDDLWQEKVRVGEIGGNTLGFLGCAVSRDRKYIIGYSFNGAMHLWKDVTNGWKPMVTLGGHFNVVTDISWEPNGEYFVSCSLDETTRLHSKWNVNSSYHEIARPQIHGYELNCITMIDRLTFATGADEKVIRLFKATKCFADTIRIISDINLSDRISDDGDDLAHCATVPSLGLSNRAIHEINQLEHSFRPSVLEEPPTEEVLLQNTLWPEIQKLYGHLFELYAVESNHCGTLIASSCKATKHEHANVILWSVKDAKQIGQLSSHQLTITQIRFSHNDNYILTVSRDRTWALFCKCADSPSGFKRIGYSDKRNGIHTRIIWDSAWTNDDKYFATVARDKTAVFWKINDFTRNDSTLGCVEPMGKPFIACDSIMSIDIAPLESEDYLTALGFENGNLSLYKWNYSNEWTHLLEINKCHHQSIQRIRFSPKVSMIGNSKSLQFASGGSDNIVKLYELVLQ